MCFHLSLSKTALELANRFDASFEEAFDPVYYANGFNHPKWPVITADKPKAIQFYEWGLVPFWVKTVQDAVRMKNNTLNAKSETVFEKPSFKFSILKRRCLVPATGFFEWRTIGGKKYPYFISRTNDACFTLAGIYENWTDKASGERMDSFSILTTSANALLEKIHDKKRMPLVLPIDEEKLWISSNLDKQGIQHLLNYQIDANDLKAHPISRLITSRTENPNVPELLLEYRYPEIESAV